MLQAALKVFGVEVDYEIARLRYHVELLRRKTILDLKSYSREAALVVGLMTAAGALMVGVASIGLVALYNVLTERYGLYVALGALAAILAVGALILFLVARSRAGQLSGEPQKPLEPPVRQIERAIPSTGASAGLNLGLARFVPDPGPGATVLETVVHHVSLQGAEAAEKAIDQAEETIRSGSRGALLTTLALTALVGVYYGRSRRKGLA